MNVTIRNMITPSGCRCRRRAGSAERLGGGGSSAAGAPALPRITQSNAPCQASGPCWGGMRGAACSPPCSAVALGFGGLAGVVLGQDALGLDEEVVEETDQAEQEGQADRAGGDVGVEPLQLPDEDRPRPRTRPAGSTRRLRKDQPATSYRLVPRSVPKFSQRLALRPRLVRTRRNGLQLALVSRLDPTGDATSSRARGKS